MLRGRLAKFVEPFDLQWLEFDNLSPADFAQIRWSTSTQIGSGETLLSARDLHPYLTAGAFDVCIIDVQYVGLPEALRMASLADAFDVNVAAFMAGETPINNECPNTTVTLVYVVV